MQPRVLYPPIITKQANLRKLSIKFPDYSSVTKKTKTPRPNNGHYIIDLLVALALMAIFIATASPSISGMLKGSLLRRETDALLAVIEKLSLEALQNEKDITLNLYRDSYFAFLEGETLRALNSHTFRAPVSAVVDAQGKKEVKFFQNGVASPSTITLLDGARSCKITVSLRGRATKIC